MKRGDIVTCGHFLGRVTLHRDWTFQRELGSPQIVGYLNRSDVGILLETLDNPRVCRILLPSGVSGWTHISTFTLKVIRNETG
jgi:hypothetical protein